MRYGPARTAARFGACALALAAILPWFGHKFGPIAISYSIWRDGGYVGIALVAVAAAAAVQPQVLGPALTGRLWLLAGVGFAGYLGYLAENPPPNNMADGILALLDLNLKPQPGIFAAIAGSLLVAYGGFLQVREGRRRTPATGLPLSDLRLTADAPRSAGLALAGGEVGSKGASPGAGRTPAIAADPFSPRPPDPFAPQPPVPAPPPAR
ncbi:MAG: hypothetical protein WAO61_09135 [Solirubrobacterales bacterium]